MYGMVSSHPEKHAHHRQHQGSASKVTWSVYRRVLNYVKQAWTGVKFALDSELEDLETPPRYRPDSLESLCRATRFTEAELKRIYRGFKAECPTGVVREDTFKGIYSRFFPQGGYTPASEEARYAFHFGTQKISHLQPPENSQAEQLWQQADFSGSQYTYDGQATQRGSTISGNFAL